jgi:hypothetical protein
MHRLTNVLGTLLAVLGPAAAASAKLPPVTFAGWLQPAFEPNDVLLACGDGNASFSVTHWSRWTRRGAKAVASAVINDCEPSCVAGHFHCQLAALILARPRACHGRTRLTRLRLVFATRPTRGQPAPITYACR